MSKKCALLWCEVYLQTRMCKTHHARTILGDSDVEKVLAIVARNAFGCEKVKNTRGLDNFLMIRWSIEIEKIEKVPAVLVQNAFANQKNNISRHT